MVVLLVLLAQLATPTPSAAPTPVPTRPAPAVGASAPARGEEPLGAAGRRIKINKAVDLGKARTVDNPNPSPNETKADPGASPAKPRAATAAKTRLEVVRVQKDRVDHIGSLWYSGVVENIGKATACFVRVAVKAYDTDGAFIASGEAHLDQTKIGPDEKSSFSGYVNAPDVMPSEVEAVTGFKGATGTTREGKRLRAAGRVEASLSSFDTDCK